MFQNYIPSESFYIVGKSLQCDTIEELINDTPYDTIYGKQLQLILQWVKV